LYVSNNLNCSEILSQKLNVHWFEKITHLLFEKKITSQYLFQDCRSQYEKINQIISNYKIDKIFVSMKWSNSEINNIDFILNYFLKKNLLDKVSVFSRRLEVLDPERVILNLKSDSSLLNNFFNNNIIFYFNINNNLKNKLKNYSLELIDIDQLTNDSDSILENKINELTIQLNYEKEILIWKVKNRGAEGNKRNWYSSSKT
jgi:hypothetical protein